MKKPLPIGIDNFKRVIDDNYYYVDKTNFIKELIDSGSYAVLIPRPRRFGKTLNLSMFRYFFEKSQQDTSYLFKDLYIGSAGDNYKIHQGKYPVINLAFKDANFLSWENTHAALKRVISDEFRKHKYLLTENFLTGTDKRKYQSIEENKADDTAYFNALKDLSRYLEDYHKEKVVILIDEYDVPVTAGYINGYYDKVIEFIRAFFSAGLKTNEHLWKGILTGCLRVSKESIFTGLNNLDVLSILENKYSEYFGLTNKEVEDMAKYYELENRLSEIKEWYNGYLFGNTEVYNPWSIIQFFDKQPEMPNAYWINTSGNELIKRLITQGGAQLKEDLQVLIDGGEIEKPINDNIIYPDIEKNNDNIWNFLLFSGYLRFGKKWSDEIKIYYKLTIPNKEVKTIYQNIILSWTNEGISGSEYDNMITALVTGEYEYFSYALNKYLTNSISYFDSEESFYHGMFLGMTLKLSNTYEVKSNRESGLGRFDIMLLPKKTSGSGAIIEFKITLPGENPEIAAQKALAQIEDKRYEQELISKGCSKVYKYGISFKDKQAYVLMK